MEVKGISEVIAQLRKYGKEVEIDIANITELVARNIEADAKKLAPTDLGKLSQSIIATEINATNWEISAGGALAPYAPFVEFGTGALVQVPAEWTELASKFKGKKIGLQDGSGFLESIKEWCKSKGIEEEFAFSIMMKLIKVGQRPQPYMYPSFVQGRKQYLTLLQKKLEKYGTVK